MVFLYLTVPSQIFKSYYSAVFSRTGKFFSDASRGEKRTMKKDDHEAQQAILEAAKKEFAAHGFQGARTASIAEKAGVNKALIHYYYKNKEQLYLEILHRSIGKFDADYDVPLYIGEMQLTASQKLYLLTYITVVAHLRAVDMDFQYILLWEIAEGGEYIRRVGEEYIGPRQKLVMQLVEEGIKTGEFESRHPNLVLMGLTSMVMSFTIDLDRGFKPSLHDMAGRKLKEEDYLDFFVEYMFKMMRPRGRELEIPEISPSIMEYVDKLIEMMTERGVSPKMYEALIKLIIGEGEK